MPPDPVRAADTRAALEPLLREAAPLTEYAWRFRYPGEAAEPAEGETNAGLALAERVVAAIVERLPPEARPGPQSSSPLTD